MVDGDTLIRLTRTELYDQVWSKPLRTLCLEYGLSDNGLRKICKKHQIPTPTVGYWAKIQHGKSVRKAPLPLIENESAGTITISKDNSAAETKSEAEYDEDVLYLLRRVHDLGPYQVGNSLRGAHPLIRAAKEGFTKAQPDDQGLLSPHDIDGMDVPSIIVSKPSVPRALRFMDALLKALEAAGGKIEFEGDRWRRRTVVKFAGLPASGIRLRERYNQRPNDKSKDSGFYWRKWRYVPNGLLLLDQGPSSYGRAYCADTAKSSRIEDAIENALIAIIKEASDTRAQERKWEALRRREAELDELREKLKEQREAEQQRVDQLLAEANAVHQSRIIRSYVELVRQAGAGKGRFDSVRALEAWVKWASQQADRIDPLVESPPSILDQTIEDLDDDFDA